jgi:quercetin dioxygenase-like cupin family protein
MQTGVQIVDTEIVAVVGKRIDLFGPSIEFLTSPCDPQKSSYVLRGIIPPGRTAPLHSHRDAEDFYVISGEVLVLRQGARGYESITCKAGDYIRVPSGVAHGRHNVSSEPFVALIITTRTLGKFFLEAGSRSSRRLNLRHPMILRGWRMYPRNTITGTPLRKRTPLPTYGFDRATRRSRCHARSRRGNATA